MNSKTNLKKVRLCFLLAAIIIGSGIAVRLYKIDSPLADHQNWRQCDTASMARNFYLNGTSILSPQIDWGGDSSGLVESEFPLFQYVVSLLYRLAGQYDILGRLFSVFLFSLSAVIFYLIVQILYGEDCACASLFFFTFSPLSIYYSRTFMPEMLLIFFIVLSLYMLLLWKEGRKKYYFHLSALFFALALLVKLLVLYLIVVFALIIYRDSSNLKKFRENILLFSSIALLPPIFWYVYAYFIYQETGLTFGILSGGFLKFISGYDWRSSLLYEKLIKRLFILMITPIGLITFCVGLLIEEKDSKRNWIYIWLTILPAVAILVAKGFYSHDYYLLPFLLPFSIIAGKGMMPVLQSSGTSVIAKAVVVLIFASAILFSGYYTLEGKMYMENGFYNVDKRLLKTSEQIAGATSQNDLIIVAGSEAVTPVPSLFYLSGRRGWYVDIEDVTSESIGVLQKKGAVLVASIEAEKIRRDEDYKEIEVTPYGAVIKLK